MATSPHQSAEDPDPLSAHQGTAQDRQRTGHAAGQVEAVDGDMVEQVALSNQVDIAKNAELAAPFFFYLADIHGSVFDGMDTGHPNLH